MPASGWFQTSGDYHMKTATRLCIAILSLTGTILATTINVPTDQATIQAGIDAAVNGDTVLVDSGLYYETIDFIGKNIVLLSSDGPSSTIIDGTGGDTTIVVNMSSWGFSADCKIDGFTIQNGLNGIAASADHSNPTLTVRSCIITNTTTAISGHFMQSWEISNTLIINNENGFAKGYYGDNSVITNCTFYGNTLKDIVFQPGYGTTVELNIYNSIFSNQIVGYDLNPVNLHYCTYLDGTLGDYVNDVEGNTIANPSFVDISSDDFTLQSASPCIDAGDPISFFNDADGSRNDMGYTGGTGILVEKSSLLFGYVSGNYDANMAIKLTNQSDDVIILTAYTTDDSQFSIYTSLPVTINPGDYTYVGFVFSPNVTGTSSGIVTVNATGIPGATSAEFNVSGYGIMHPGGPIIVPGIAPTIQSAIDIAVNGDTILVASGAYQENVIVNKQLAFNTVDGPKSTIIDGNGSYGMQILAGNPGSISGFSFINSTSGILIADCGIYTVENCIFRNNTQGLSSSRNTNLSLSYSLFFDNDYGFVQGYYGYDCVITNCTFDNPNDILFQPSYGTTAELTISNSILLGQINGHDQNPVNLYYCDFIDSTILGLNVNTIEGNITADPLFVDQSNSNYNLQVLSPCINAGNPDLDADGESWSVDQDDQDPDGTRLDIGGLYLHNTNVWIDDTEYFAGDTVMIPIMVSFAPDSSYSSASLQLSGYNNYIEFLGLATESTLISDSWTYEYNETDTTLLIGLAGSNNINGSGELFYLSFYMPDTAQGIIPLTINTAVFDEGFYPTVISSGVTSIYQIAPGDVSQNGDISPFDASLILKYLVGVEQLDRHQLYNANVTLDSTVSALDASYILQYGVGLIDSLPYSDNAIALGDMQMDDGEFENGTDINLPLHISNGSNVLSFEGSITFDPEYLVYQDIIWSELLDGFVIEVSVQEGEINFAGAGSTSDGETGIFSTINFIPHDNFANDQTTVSLASLRWNEGETHIDVASSVIMSVVSTDNETEIPSSYTLGQNYPNPFNPTTTISYGLPESADVSIVIYDIKGREVTNLVQTNQPAGWHDATWNSMTDAGNQVSTGVYFARIKAGNFTDVIKMVYLQ